MGYGTRNVRSHYSPDAIGLTKQRDETASSWWSGVVSQLDRHQRQARRLLLLGCEVTTAAVGGPFTYRNYEDGPNSSRRREPRFGSLVAGWPSPAKKWPNATAAPAGLTHTGLSDQSGWNKYTGCGAAVQEASSTRIPPVPRRKPGQTEAGSIPSREDPRQVVRVASTFTRIVRRLYISRPRRIVHSARTSLPQCVIQLFADRRAPPLRQKPG